MAATTAQSLMDKSLRALGVLRVGASAASSMQTEALGVLNAMIDRWASERLSIPQIAQTTKTLAAGEGDYTVIASTGDIPIARPHKVEDSSFIRWDSQDYGLTQLTREQYNAIGDKTSQGLPEAFFYDAQNPTATLYLWPVPSQAYVLYLDYWSALGSFATAATSINLPPAAEAALWQNLALELWPMYPNPAVYQAIARMASISKQALQRTNVSVPILEGTFGGGRYDAVSDR